MLETSDWSLPVGARPSCPQTAETKAVTKGCQVTGAIAASLVRWPRIHGFPNPENRSSTKAASPPERRSAGHPDELEAAESSRMDGAQDSAEECEMNM